MKKTLALIVAAFVLVSMMAMSASAELGFDYQAKIGTPVVDGTIEELWDAVEWTNIAEPYTDGDGSISSARAKILYDAEQIYFLCEVTDATVGSDQDFLEFYLDESGLRDVAYDDTCYQLRMGIDSVDNIQEGSSNTMTHAEQVTAYAIGSNENGYVLEWAVKPAVAMDHKFALEFMYNDSDDTGAFIWAWRWNVETRNGDTAPWQAPECWGFLTFTGESAIVEAPVEDAPVEDAPVENGAAEDVVVVAAPETADAGIVVAAVVMAAAAAVVVSKKH